MLRARLSNGVFAIELDLRGFAPVLSLWRTHILLPWNRWALAEMGGLHRDAPSRVFRIAELERSSQVNQPRAPWPFPTRPPAPPEPGKRKERA